MLSRVRTFALLGVVILGVSFAIGKYKPKTLEIRAAGDYAAHQSFQDLVIGAYPCHTLARTLELFDTDKVFEKGLMPVLVVIQNDGPFPVQIDESEIYLIDEEGRRNPPISYLDALLEINSKKSKTNRPNIKDVQKLVKKEMLSDFKEKAFGSKIVQPGSSGHGVVFFRRPENGNLANTRLYLPEIVNTTDNARLMFFEFDLQ